MHELEFTSRDVATLCAALTLLSTPDALRICAYIKRETERTYELRIVRVGDGAAFPDEIITTETVTSTYLVAENRLSDLWNRSPGVMEDERYEARLLYDCQVVSTIGGPKHY